MNETNDTLLGLPGQVVLLVWYTTSTYLPMSHSPAKARKSPQHVKGQLLSNHVFSIFELNFHVPSEF